MKRGKINITALIYAVEESSGWKAKRITPETFKIHKKTITVRGRTIVINDKSLSYNGSATDAMRVLDIDICKRGAYFYMLHQIQRAT
jgi:hypothetical protein